MSLIYFSRLKSNHQPNQAGFTIVELMIALSILSLILLLSTYGIIQIGTLYSKGMNQTNTQNAARNIMNNIASQIQMGGATPIFQVPITPPIASPSTPSSVGAICIGSKRYSFIVNHKLTSTANDHVLWYDVMDDSTTCQPISSLTTFSYNATPEARNHSIPNNGSELIPLNMRLTDLNISSANGLYTITVSLAYGDDDLINYTARVPIPAAAAITTCNNGKGSEFCASATLTQTIAPRLAE